MRDNGCMPPARASNPPAGPTQVRIGEMLRRGAKRLAAVSDSPRLDCELLLAHALSIPRAALYARSSAALAPEHADRIGIMLEERAGGRPVAQIIGRKEFFSLEFEITPEALTPRPETELLVEVVAGHLETIDRDANCLDLGTGCGAVAIALTRLLPEVGMLATDISPTALDVARRNAARLVPGRVSFAQGFLVRSGWRRKAIRCHRFQSAVCRIAALPAQATVF